jgi:hypothetical protein
MQNKKRQISQIKCPRCKKTPIRFDEVGTVSTSYFVENMEIESHQLNPGDFSPLCVMAICSCGYSWRLKGILSMENIGDFKKYDEATEEKLNPKVYNYIKGKRTDSYE